MPQQLLFLEVHMKEQIQITGWKLAWMANAALKECGADPHTPAQAAACGMPIISTDVGDVKCIDGCEVVNTVTEMAQRLEEYSSQKRVYEQKSVAACEWAEKHCRKKVIVDIFEKSIKEDRKYC